MSAEDRRYIAENVERLRRIVSRTPPWRVVERDGEVLLWDTREDRRLATLDDGWTSDVARYLDALHPYATIRLVELLWRVGQSMNVEREATALLKAMRLEPGDSPSPAG